MNLDRPTRCIRLLQTDSLERVKIVSGRSVDLYFQRAKPITEKVVYDDVYLASFGRKVITALFTNMRTLKLKSRLHNCVFRCRQS